MPRREMTRTISACHVGTFVGGKRHENGKIALSKSVEKI